MTTFYDASANASWAYSNHTNLFYTYDDPRSIRAKGDYVRAKNLAGIFAWDFSGDDENHSLTDALTSELAGDEYDAGFWDTHTPPPANETKPATTIGVDVTIPVQPSGLPNAQSSGGLSFTAIASIAGGTSLLLFSALGVFSYMRHQRRKPVPHDPEVDAGPTLRPMVLRRRQSAHVKGIAPSASRENLLRA